MKPIPTANAMKPAPGKGVSSFPTPVIQDTVIVEVVNAWSGSYTPLEYGTKWDDVPHASVQGSYPDHKLISQAPNSEDGQWVKRIWANDRVDQDTYNYAIKYSGGSDAHPIYIRTYIEPRETYAPVQDGTPDPLFLGAVLVDEEVNRDESELDSRYLKVTRVYETLPGPIIPTQRINERGDLETVNTQTVPPGTLPDPDGLLVTQSQVVQEEVSKGVKTTATVSSHSSLAGRERKSGLLANTSFLDSIVAPNTQPDNLTFAGSGGIVESTIQPISATKSKKITITSTGPVKLDADSLVDSPLGLVKANVEKSIVTPDTQPTSDPNQGLTTIRDNIEALDEVKSQRELVNVEQWPTNTGVDYDEQLGIGIYYTETIVNPSEYTNPNYWEDLSNKNYKPIDQWKSLRREIDKNKIKESLLSQWYKIATDVDISLPDKLLSATVYWGRSGGVGKAYTFDVGASTGSYSASGSGSSKNSASINGDIYFNVQQGFRGAIPGFQHIFFLEIGNDGRVDSGDILNVLNNLEAYGQQTKPAPSPNDSVQIVSVQRNAGTSIVTTTNHGLFQNLNIQVASGSQTSFNGSFLANPISPTSFQYSQPGEPDVPLTSASGSVVFINPNILISQPPPQKYKRWPYLQARSENLVIVAGGKSERFNSSSSQSVNINGFSRGGGEGSDIDVDVSARSINVPQTLHGPITIEEQFFGSFVSNLTPTYFIQPKTLAPTTAVINGQPFQAPTFPTGEYLYSSNVELYKYGFVKVSAITVNITNSYV